MERLLVLYYMRAGYLRATARAIIGAAQSVGAVARIGSPGTVMPFLPYEPRRGIAATREPLFGVSAVVISPLGRGSAYRSSVHSILRTVAFRGMRGTKYRKGLALGSALKARATAPSQGGSLGDLRADPRMKELLSAAIANSKACQNWLSKPEPNLERARVSIDHVIRDVNDLARVFD